MAHVSDEVQVIGSAGADEVNPAVFREERRNRDRLAVTLRSEEHESTPLEAIPPRPLPCPSQEDDVRITTGKQCIPGFAREPWIIETVEANRGDLRHDLRSTTPR